MVDRTAVTVLVVVLLLCLPLASVSTLPAGEDRDAPTQGAPGSILGQPLGLSAAVPSATDALVPGESAPTDDEAATSPSPRYAVDRQVGVVVELAPDGTVPRDQGFVVERTYTRERDRVVEGTASLAAVQRLTGEPGVRSIRITSPAAPTDSSVASGVSLVGADTFHARGRVGQNVTIGVIDAGFRVDHPALAGSVGAYRPFGESTDWEHGTAVASVLVDTAPGARLHLASVGSTTTASEYAAAVAWLRESGADVIIDAGSYYGQPGTGSGEIAEVAGAAAEETVFVTSVGNHARRYWTGNHSGTGYVEFADGVEGNRLNGTVSGTVHVSLRWGGWPETTTDYDLYLLRKRPGRDTLVASATGHDGDPYEAITTTVPPGEYYVAIRGVSGVDNGTRLELFTSTALRHRSSGGQVSPATAAGVITVGASHNGSVAPFSAAGPDIVAPDTVAAAGVSVDGGTSFAAPYVAGTAALILSSDPDLTPAEVRTIIRRTATDIGPPGVDPATGSGELNVARIDALFSITGPVAYGADGTAGVSDDRPAERTAAARAGSRIRAV